jgi:phosphomannomutase/phosphomannomutase/phosphoglucomutase
MTALSPLPAFKAYDVRGPVPAQLHADMVFAIGRAYARVIKPQGPVAICRDVRASSDDFARILAAGLNSEGVVTRDIGIGGTEMVYHAAGQAGMGGGIMITASHNPVGDNGLKMVRAESRPISADDGLVEIERETRLWLNEQAGLRDSLADYAGGPFSDGSHYQPNPALHSMWDTAEDYISRVRGFVNFAALHSATSMRRIIGKPLKVVVNAGNGCAGPWFDAIADGLDMDIIRVFHEPDGTFPNGVPNPMLAHCQQQTAQVVRREKADLGIAWDGDFDRCFFFDETGAFIEGYYLVGLLGAQLLHHEPGGTVVYDTRMTWNTIELVQALGGKTVMSKCGHSFIKTALRRENAVYGGEMSAHHYFRDFFYCDSGMIPWLLLLERLLADDQPLSSLVAKAQAAYPCSGEINFKVADAGVALARVQAAVEIAVAAGQETLVSQNDLDGLSREFSQWRFNLRRSNTEPVVRLNVESRGDTALMLAKTEWLRGLIEGQ